MPYEIIEPAVKKVPIILSIPHVGTKFPDEIKEDYREKRLADLDDTDWFLDQLYDFAPEMGITVIKAVYSRWVIDLNRDPESIPLYGDGRLITGLCSTTNFLGESLYKEGMEPDQHEIERRLKLYYRPYFEKVQALLEDRKVAFGEALLWDAHSIRSKVPTIRTEKFPEMILGTAEGKSADNRFVQAALSSLRKDYEVNLNDPFKGGRITRYFGKPEEGIHALQLERNKDLYMDDSERNYHPDRAEKMKVTLKRTFKALIDQF